MRRDEPEVLDFRKQEERRTPAAFLELFDSLDEGVVLELRDRSCLDDLLGVLQERRADQFEWWPLEREEPLFRVLMVRRPPGAGPRSLTDLFATDHSRMRGLFEQVLRAIRDGDRQGAATSFAELRLGLGRHARGEEELLFPILAEGAEEDAEDQLRALSLEHRQIREQAREVHELFGAEERFDQALVEEAVLRMWRHVQVHEEREERTLLPLCDRLVESTERRRKVEKAQRY